MYRKGHYVVAEYTDAQHNRKLPNHPWEVCLILYFSQPTHNEFLVCCLYSVTRIYHFLTDVQFGETQVVPKVKLPDIIQAIISSLAGPESETHSNQLVLVIHDKENAVEWMGELKISE